MNLYRFLFLLVFPFFLFTGCKPNGPASDVSKGRVFVASFQTLNNPVFVEINDSLKAVIESHGDRLVSLDAQFNSQKQQNDITDMLQQQPAAVFINPVNWEDVKGALIEAKIRNVPVIIVDAPVSDPDLVLCQVTSDNVKAGRLACESLAKAKPDAKIVILHLSVNRACIERVEGFKAEMVKYPGMKILDTREGEGTIDGSFPVMRDLLMRYPELNAVFAINDPSALGAVAAIEAAGRVGKVTVVSVDGSREGAAAIQAGKILSSTAQFPNEIGRVAAEKAYEYLAGKPVEKNIKIPVKLITKENGSM